MTSNMDITIKNLVNATLGDSASLRDTRMLTESLRSLVRLAKAEQMSEIRTSVTKLTGSITSGAQRRKNKVDSLLKGDAATVTRQGSLELNPNEQGKSDSPCGSQRKP